MKSQTLLIMLDAQKGLEGDPKYKDISGIYSNTNL